MKKFGKELIFISCIKSDGTGVYKPSQKEISTLQNEPFYLSCLSITNKTWIANGFSSFVVKLKILEDKKCRQCHR